MSFPFSNMMGGGYPMGPPQPPQNWQDQQRFQQLQQGFMPMPHPQQPQMGMPGYPTMPMAGGGMPPYPMQGPQGPPNVGYMQPGFGGMQPGFAPQQQHGLMQSFLISQGPGPIDFDQGGPKPDDAYGGGAMEFSDQSIRRAFIRKVYSILTLQMVVTVGFIALFLFHTPTKHWMRQNPGFFFGALGISFVLLIALTCCESVRRKSPTNIILLAVFTLAEAIVLGAAASTYNQKSVLIAIGVTAGVCFALTLFSFQTKWDFTASGGILFVCCIVLMLFGLLTLLIKVPILHTVYACLGALLFSVYLVYDTQMLMGGKHKHSISPEEYIFAVLSLYLDIVQIFMFLLQIFGTRGDD